QPLLGDGDLGVVPRQIAGAAASARLPVAEGSDGRRSPRIGLADRRARVAPPRFIKAFSSEVGTGSREENASNQYHGVSLLIQSEAIMLWSEASSGSARGWNAVHRFSGSCWSA